MTAAFVHLFGNEISKERTVPKDQEELTIGIYGAGGPNSGDNSTLKALVVSMDGTVYTEFDRGYLLDVLEANPNAKITLIGYSRGGNAAVWLANQAGKAGINIDTLITFDPHKLVGGDFVLRYNNVGRAFNYYQQNPRTWGPILPFGNNPYTGRSVTSEFINVRNINYTGRQNVNHLNIITEVLTNGGN